MQMQVDLSDTELGAVEIIEVASNGLVVSFDGVLDITLKFDQLQALCLAVGPWSAHG